MNGTTISAKRAMRVTPPKMMKASTMTMTAALIAGAHAPGVVDAGRDPVRLHARQQKARRDHVVKAKIQAYHFWPIAFSM